MSKILLRRVHLYIFRNDYLLTDVQVRHRESASHNCSPIEPPSQPTKNEAARALLAKNFPSTSNATSKTSVKRQPGKSADPKKTAALRKLELMKLRQQAEPLDPRNLKSTLPPDKRRFFKAKMDGRPIKDFWVEKNLLTGKAFDLLVTHFGIPTVETNKYQLHISADEQEEEKRSLEYDKPLADQMEDGEVLLISPDTSSNLPAAI
ncbi:hypothetical protein GYMLUDRAFT_41865 [Collybiopsis luxurians FD-317 M1]|uniref:Uncharacterized protein n=1 Tax=Collybiopsis luxurians FD-317 M1 TaxID=944289 RepID=A0A0D0D0C0_9AGAR|nr:hypothetical protein GYMLUDRAFT_41865 [Collybiopsis luxurians FD-317 M1]